jgi:hypothetical protein
MAWVLPPRVPPPPPPPPLPPSPKPDYSAIANAMIEILFALFKRYIPTLQTQQATLLSNICSETCVSMNKHVSTSLEAPKVFEECKRTLKERGALIAIDNN